MADAFIGKPNATPTGATPVPHPSTCPICGQPAEHERFKPSISGVSTSLYHCASAHLWKTQWAEVA